LTVNEVAELTGLAVGTWYRTVCGSLAAAGFGVLFNVGFRGLTWCAVSGALELALRTVAFDGGWTMESASFVAALALGAAVQLVPSRFPVSRSALHVVGCVPMIPGALAAKVILRLLAVTAQHPAIKETFMQQALSQDTKPRLRIQ
jgi:uncharacterized membrane protein YjjB (DUF3815 family)